jgi:hypothetical protein
MLETLIGGALSILTGGATGLIGIGLQRFFDHLKVKQETEQLKLKFEHERGLRQIDLQIMGEEWKGRVLVATKEGEAAMDVAQSKAFEQTLWKEPDRYSDPKKVSPIANFFLVLLDVVRGIVRPGLTVYLCWIATQMYEQSRALMAVLDLEDPKVIAEVYKHLVFTLLYLFVTCVTWWFGTRNKAPQPGSR